MKVTRREVLFEGNYLRVVEKYVEKGTSEKWTWEAIERVNVYGRGAVVIAAITGDNELLLERNWRAPIESFIIQFPAGLTDKQGENEEESARRELMEETGYLAEELFPIISMPISPDLTSIEATYFFAPQVEFTGQNRTDSTEVIEVIKVPLSSLDNFLLNPPADTVVDLRVMGFIWLLRQRNLI